MSADSRVNVDEQKCRDVASLLRELTVPTDTEEATTLEGRIPAEHIPNIYLALVAICHQTSPRGQAPLAGRIRGEQEPRAGWDYLRQAFLLAGVANPAFAVPACLAAFTDGELNRIVQIADAPVHLSDIAGRVKLLRSLGYAMEHSGTSSVSQIFAESDGYLEGSDGLGLIERISNLPAFGDPVRKKTLYFLALMQNLGVWEYKDPGALGAPVDYHEVRGHLRCGTVRITDSGLRETIHRGEDVGHDVDIAIRTAVHRAIGLIAAETGFTPSQLHYLFWNIFRACCKRDNTHCVGCGADCKLPPRYAALTANDRKCVFAPLCSSRDVERKLIEHQCMTDFY